MMKSICRSICLLCLAYCAGAADAKLITKQLHDVSFADGGKAFGSLVFDTRTKGIVDFDITTTPGNSIPSSFRYRSGTARITQESNDAGAGWPFSFLQINAQFDASAGGRDLFLAFAGPIAADKPTSILHSDGLGQMSYELENQGQHLHRQRLIAGAASIQSSPIPEPSGIAFLGLGLSLLWRIRRECCVSKDAIKGQ
jgi:hypothetical protein